MRNNPKIIPKSWRPTLKWYSWKSTRSFRSKYALSLFYVWKWVPFAVHNREGLRETYFTDCMSHKEYTQRCVASSLYKWWLRIGMSFVDFQLFIIFYSKFVDPIYINFDFIMHDEYLCSYIIILFLLYILFSNIKDIFRTYFFKIYFLTLDSIWI